MYVLQMYERLNSALRFASSDTFLESFSHSGVWLARARPLVIATSLYIAYLPHRENILLSSGAAGLDAVDDWI